MCEAEQADISAAQKLMKDYPVMKKIAQCESNNRQFYENGEVVIGKITPDIGRWQINPIHLPEARRKGIDVYTAKGNAKFARILYERNGTRDWRASKDCWGQYAYNNK